MVENMQNFRINQKSGKENDSNLCNFHPTLLNSTQYLVQLCRNQKIRRRPSNHSPPPPGDGND